MGCCVAHCVSICMSSNPLSHHHHRQGCSDIYATSIPVRKSSSSTRRIGKVKQLSILGHHRRRLLRLSPFCSAENNAYGTSDLHGSSADHGGPTEKNEKGQGESLTSTEILKRLRRYGISGILSYGLLNTAYYLTAFLLVWFYVAPAPGRMGYSAAVERFLKIMAMVWAGSQITKLVRAGGALALAPFVDTGLSWFTAKFKFESQGKAFMAIVGCCCGLAVMLFFIITLLWA